MKKLINKNTGNSIKPVSWDEDYKTKGKIWNDKPSELAVIMMKYLKDSSWDNKELKILNIGCGYGRDELFLKEQLNCKILAIDNSSIAIDIANRNKFKNINFKHCGFEEINDNKYDVIFISNLYHLLEKHERIKLIRKIRNILKNNGLLFINAISINDPEEYGKGEPDPDESDSFKNEKYVHFTNKKELEKNFNFLKIEKLHEHKYDEHHTSGIIHHHISWILIGKFISED